MDRRHVAIADLRAASADLINLYSRFELPRQWGSGDAAAADGTHFETYQDNLLAEDHIRYGKTGGIAYRHIADNYIALFSRFIASGTYEATRCDVQWHRVLGTDPGALPEVHATHVGPPGRRSGSIGRPRSNQQLQHTKSVSPGLVGLGKAVRTTHLLEWIMNDSLRRTVHKGTTKIKRHHEFAKHLAFGGDGLFRSNDPADQEKAIVYNELVANAFALQTVVDQTQALHALKSNGVPIDFGDLAFLSPYPTSRLKRFGDYRPT